MIKSAELLIEKGAKEVHAYITHGVLSEAIERISNSNLSSMVITDTIEPTEVVTKCAKIRIITAAPLLAHAMLNISNESSVSSLFSEESLKPIYEGLYSN